MWKGWDCRVWGFGSRIRVLDRESVCLQRFDARFAGEVSFFAGAERVQTPIGRFGTRSKLAIGPTEIRCDGGNIKKKLKINIRS